MGNDNNSGHLMCLSMILILLVETQKNTEDETKKFRDKKYQHSSSDSYISVRDSSGKYHRGGTGKNESFCSVF